MNVILQSDITTAKFKNDDIRRITWYNSQTINLISCNKLLAVIESMFNFRPIWILRCLKLKIC